MLEARNGKPSITHASKIVSTRRGPLAFHRIRQPKQITNNAHSFLSIYSKKIERKRANSRCYYDRTQKGKGGYTKRRKKINPACHTYQAASRTLLPHCLGMKRGRKQRGLEQIPTTGRTRTKAKRLTNAVMDQSKKSTTRENGLGNQGRQEKAPAPPRLAGSRLSSIPGLTAGCREIQSRKGFEAGTNRRRNSISRRSAYLDGRSNGGRAGGRAGGLSSAPPVAAGYP